MTALSSQLACHCGLGTFGCCLRVSACEPTAGRACVKRGRNERHYTVSRGKCSNGAHLLSIAGIGI
jgi:hypothetical protein